MFATGIFTDVPAAEAADGRGGFTFQAVSSGFTDADELVGREFMLHRVAAGAPEGSTRESFVCRAEGGRYYVARGRGLGVTASGRPGNQITEIAVTGDASDLEPYCPAQLYACELWNVEKRDSRVAEEWPPPVALAPVEVAGGDGPADFETATLVEWARSDPRRWAALPVLLSAVEGKLTGRNAATVVLAHRDLTTLVGWFALACTLSNAAAARRLSFRAMDDDPLASGVDVAGCAPDVVARGLRGAVVVDLEAPTPSATQPSFAVQRTMQLLGDGDVDEALGVIMLARTWEPAVGDRSAFWAAELVQGTLPDEAMVQPRAMITDLLAGLAKGGFGDDLALYVEEFADALRRSRSGGPDELLGLARAAVENVRGGDHVLAGILMEATLQELEQRPDLAGQWAGVLLGAGIDPWPTSQDRAHWAVGLAGVARRVADSNPADLPALFEVGGHLTEALDPAFWGTLAARFTDVALSNPRAVAATAGLGNGAMLRDRVRTALLQRLDPLRASDAELPTPAPAAWTELQGGVWTELVRLSATDTGPSADGLRLWDAIAGLARLDARSRLRELRRWTHLDPRDWSLMLSGTRVREDRELWNGWIELVGTSEGLARHIVRAAQHDLADTSAPERELERWRGWLTELTTRGRLSGVDVTEVLQGFDQRLGPRQSTGEKMARWFGFKAESGQDDQADPPAPSDGETAREAPRSSRQDRGADK